jgi:DnaK suppressor protein
MLTDETRFGGDAAARPTGGRPAAAASTSFHESSHPMTESEREGYRSKLQALGDRLKGDVSALSKEALRVAGGEASGNLSNTPFHTADLGTDNFEQELSTSLLENQDQILQDIAAAMRRLDNGTYGKCELCGKEIPKQRLQAAPHAPYCIDCARQLEQEGARGRKAAGL